MANKIAARDCMPFVIKKERPCSKDNIIPQNSDKKDLNAYIKVLTQFVDSVIPVSIFNDNSLKDDVESKLAYSPFENQPLVFRKDNDAETVRAWQAGRYVGSARIGDTIIEITPRFGEEWLKYVLYDIFNFKLTKSKDSKTTGEQNPLMLRILWHIWVRKFAEADQYGLPRSTVKRIHQGIQTRGHLNIRKSIFPFFTKRQVVSEYREKEIDDAICEIVYKAYGILMNRNIKNPNVPSQIQDTLNSLHTHYKGKAISVTEQDYQDVNYKSIYLSWKPLVDFSWQIIKQDSLFKKTNKPKGESFSIFFDMAEIWETFLRKKLGEGFADDGWRVLSVEECKYKIYQGKFFERLIIPDIILTRTSEKGESEYMVFDAKYKRMRINKSKGYDVDRTDLFQIHTYIQFVEHHLGHVVVGGLLYPLTQKVQDNEGNEVEFKIDTDRFHSANLYGKESGKYSNTSFIIDGVFCSKSDDAEGNVGAMDTNVTEMIDRIKNYL